MKILVTGGSGSLGTKLVSRLVTVGRPVRVLSRRERPARRDWNVEWAAGDLASCTGLAAAVDGVDAIVHAASDPRRTEAVDVAGTRHLLIAAAGAGVKHIVYVSIVGVDEIPYPYYRRKYEVERMIMSADTPWTILRATQFHSFVEAMLRSLARVPLIMPLPAGFSFQSVDENEVAGRLVGCVDAGPATVVLNYGGPEVLRMEDMAAAWMAARSLSKPIVRLPLPGRTAAAFRAGKNTAPAVERGILRWRDWLDREAP